MRVGESERAAEVGSGLGRMEDDGCGLWRLEEGEKPFEGSEGVGPIVGEVGEAWVSRWRNL